MRFPKMTHTRRTGLNIRPGLTALAVAGLVSGSVWLGAPADAAANSRAGVAQAAAVKTVHPHQRTAGLMAVQLQGPALASAAVHTATSVAPASTPGTRYGLLAILLAAFVGMATLTTNLWREAGRAYD